MAMGCDAKKAEQEIAALFAHIVGLLLLSHTGRIRMFRGESSALFAQYLNNMVERLRGPAPRQRKRPARAP